MKIYYTSVLCKTNYECIFLLLLLLCRHTLSKESNPLIDPQGVSRFWWAQKPNCPKLFKEHFCFWPKNSKLKNKTQKWPLKVKKHFLTVKKVIHFLTNKERPDFQTNWTFLAQNCPKINFAFDQKILNSKMIP